MYKCIFCLEESENFNTVEHIIPESLGNTDDILCNALCDKCQNYFGKELENFVLSKTPFAFWRTIYGTKSKKGKDPFFDMSLSKKDKGAISNYHPFSDSNIVIRPTSFNDEFIIAADICDREILEQIRNGQKQEFNLLLTPKMLIYIGRFLGKVALEYWHKAFGEDVFNIKFNELRRYVRYGTKNKIWPVLRADLNENLLKFRAINEIEEERTLYAYTFYEDVQSKAIVFCFDIGSERYSLILNHKYPDGSIFTEQLLSRICNQTTGLPDILYYE